MLCSQVNIRKQAENETEIKLLPCRSWKCEVCAPKRRNQLMALAATGQPTICLTLTSNRNNEGTPETRYKELHEAWRSLIKRTVRQFSKPPEKRWVTKTDEGYEYQEIRGYRITRKTPTKEIRRLHYMAFAEETKKGEPHLHILLRIPYIPQRWLSQQMKELSNSPILWVEKIKGVKAAIAYVSKYCTKAPAQFGKSRRYWISKYYQINTPDHYIKEVFSRLTHTIIRQRFTELVQEIVDKRMLVRQISKNTIGVTTLRQWAMKAGADAALHDDAELAKGAHWLGSWRTILRI